MFIYENGSTRTELVWDSNLAAMTSLLQDLKTSKKITQLFQKIVS